MEALLSRLPELIAVKSGKYFFVWCVCLVGCFSCKQSTKIIYRRLYHKDDKKI